MAVVFDEGGDNAGCCTASPGGGQVAAVVVTSHGPRHVTDATPANHYSLLSTIQQSFGLGCLQNTCDTTNVKPLSGLFAVTGSPAIATHVTEVPNIAPPPPAPVSFQDEVRQHLVQISNPLGDQTSYVVEARYP